MITRPVLTTREDVARALDVRATAHAYARVDTAVEAATDAVTGLLHRTIIPWEGARAFDWPDPNRARSWRLWLNQHDLITPTAITSGGATIDPDDVLLYPTGGPPYTRVEIDLDGPAAWSSGDTHQRAVTITGTWGYSDGHITAGELAANITSTATTVDVTDGGRVHVGDLLRAGSERLLVADRAMVDSGETLAGNVTASASATSIPVADATAFGPDEVLLVDGERMLVVDVLTTTLIVRRAWDGTPLAAHTTGATIYASRRLTVQRGAQGTTAAAHTSGDGLERWCAPSLVRRLTTAEAIAIVQQEAAGWARTAGSGDSEREVSGRGLALLREQTYTTYGRKARKRAV